MKHEIFVISRNDWGINVRLSCFVVRHDLLMDFTFLKDWNVRDGERTALSVAKAVQIRDDFPTPD